MLNIVIFGAPGSGKGTQSERIVAKYGINHISTGDVLRAEIKNNTELGKVAKGYIDQGQLLPDNLIVDMLAAKLDSFEESKGVIFAGFPRTIAPNNCNLRQFIINKFCFFAGTFYKLCINKSYFFHMLYYNRFLP